MIRPVRTSRNLATPSPVCAISAEKDRVIEKWNQSREEQQICPIIYNDQFHHATL